MAEYNPSKIIKDGNTYNFSDNTKIPLAGSNAISGDLIPATDNSIDIGSSTNNIKALYTKGITIDGKTIDTDANGNMTFNGHIVDTIEEQGDGYIRYSNGIQICWGTIVKQTQLMPLTFGKSFLTDSSYGIVACSAHNSNCWIPTRTATGVTFSTEITDGGYRRVDWLVIGTWK